MTYHNTNWTFYASPSSVYEAIFFIVIYSIAGSDNWVQMIPRVNVYVIEYELHNTDRKVKGGDVTLIR